MVSDRCCAPGATRVVKDAKGNVLQDGDTVTVIKDLKVKGSSLVVKVQTKQEHSTGHTVQRLGNGTARPNHCLS
jgi:alkylphosphonate utilization operon protein PhnA